MLVQYAEQICFGHVHKMSFDVSYNIISLIGINSFLFKKASPTSIRQWLLSLLLAWYKLHLPIIMQIIMQ